MPKERTPTRKIKEVLRLTWSAGLGSRAIARSVKIGKTTVDELVRRATEAGDHLGTLMHLVHSANLTRTLPLSPPHN